MASSDSSYLNYTRLLDPAFSPAAYANALILATNNPSDTTIDLSTPLSRVLFDAQEVDTTIDTLTTQNAGLIIKDTQVKAGASTAVLEAVEVQVAGLKESYERLEREVLQRWEGAEQVRLVAERLVSALRLGRKVQRCLQLGRQLEGLVEEGSTVGAAETVVDLRAVLAEKDVELEKVRVVNSLRTEVLLPAERTLIQRAQGVVKEFSMSGLLAAGSLHHQQQHQQQQQQPALDFTTTTQQQQQQQTQTFARTEETKSRASTAIHTLYLLSPPSPRPSAAAITAASTPFEPTLLLSALTSYIQTSLSSSLASLTRSLSNLPTLDRTLLEIAARCQNIVALENLLSALKPPLLESTTHYSADTTLLQSLLRHLDTASLPSYFWRSLAGSLTTRVHEILSKGGSTARTLRASRDRVRESIRECVNRGSRLPTGADRRGQAGVVDTWEREAAVMVGSVVGPLTR